MLIIDQAYIASGVTPQKYKTTFEKGKYYPIRFMWANSGGPRYFSFKVMAPDGTVVINDKTTSCPYLVKYGCNEADNAPPFADWGAEP
jgi:hypothetical protein